MATDRLAGPAIGREFSAGLTAGLMTLPVCLSVGFLAFAPLGPALILSGLAASVLAAPALAGEPSSALALMALAVALTGGLQIVGGGLPVCPLPLAMLLGALTAFLVLRPPRALRRFPSPFVALPVGMAIYQGLARVAPRVWLGATLGHIPVAFPPVFPDFPGATGAVAREPVALGGAVVPAPPMAATLSTLESLLTFRGGRPRGRRAGVGCRPDPA